jgi:multiple sugar transport system substrate-binding protein
MYAPARSRQSGRPKRHKPVARELANYEEEHMIPRRQFAGGLIATAALLAAGCSSSKSSSGTAASSAAPTSFAGQELVLLFTGTAQVAEKDYYLNTYIPNFEKKYGVKVTVNFVTQADGITKVGAEQSSGKVVSDVLYVDTANMSPYVGGGWMTDITDTVKQAKITLTDMYDSVMVKDGKRLFTPNSFDIYLLIANKKALPYLPSGVTEANVKSGITWEQYADWANKIAAGEGKGRTMFPANLTASQLLYPIGGMGLSYGASFPSFDQPGMKDALGIIATMAKGNAFYSEQAQYTAPTDPLKSGDVWLTFAHMGPVGIAYNAAPNNYTVGAAPKGSAGAGSTSGSWAYGIQKGAPHTALAQEFIKYAMTPKVNYEMCSQMGGVLSPIQEVKDLLGSDDVIMSAGAEMLKGTKIAGVPSTNYKDWNAVKLLYGKVFNQVLSTKAVPADSYLAQAQADLVALKK